MCIEKEVNVKPIKLWYFSFCTKHGKYWVVRELRDTTSPAKSPKRTNLQTLWNISRKKWEIKLIFLFRWALQVSINWYYHLWWVWPGMLTLLKITSMQYLKKELSCDVDILEANKEEYLLQVDSIIFHRFGLACQNYHAKFAISLGNLKKEARNEVRNLTALAGSNILLLQFIIHPVFSHHWAFSTINMVFIPILNFTWLIVCVT